LRPTLIPGTFLRGVEERGYGNCTKCAGTITRRERGVGGGGTRKKEVEKGRRKRKKQDIHSTNFLSTRYDVKLQ